MSLMPLLVVRQALLSMKLPPLLRLAASALLQRPRKSPPRSSGSRRGSSWASNSRRGSSARHRRLPKPRWRVIEATPSTRLPASPITRTRPSASAPVRGTGRQTTSGAGASGSGPARRPSAATDALKEVYYRIDEEVLIEGRRRSRHHQAPAGSRQQTLVGQPGRRCLGSSTSHSGSWLGRMTSPC